ncbi:kinase-like domain-containing protein [Gaertneriomyces semiglobifer]|nr:kinase-like domain-containing protein [Gaertneriomyces semiglobifer]
MPVHIPSASAQSYDRFLNSPPSTISSESSSPSGAEVDSQSWFTARHRDSRGGIRRSRHSLSVNIVRRKTANSGGSSPVTSGSYSSLAQSPAVSFLATLADMSANKSTQPTGEYNPGDQVGDYILGREVGSGAFSRVFEAEVIDGPHKHMGKVAIKVIRKDLHKDAQEIQRLVDHETNIWARLRHPHILEMLDLMDGEDAIFIVSELACNGNLLDLIRKETRIPEARARKLFLQIADAVRYIHQEVQVIHRDIKCENILLDCEGNTKLADFGLAVEWTPPTNPGEPPTEPVFCSGSLHYCSPEELKQSTHYNPASDIWSLGCVLFAMLAGSLPFNDGFLPRLQKMIVNGRYDVSKLANANVSQSAKDLIAGMLRTKPEERFSMRDIMNHPWVMHEAGAC